VRACSVQHAARLQDNRRFWRDLSVKFDSGIQASRQRHGLKDEDIVQVLKSFCRGVMDSQIRVATWTGAAVVGPTWTCIKEIVQALLDTRESTILPFTCASHLATIFVYCLFLKILPLRVSSQCFGSGSLILLNSRR
jgi:hypothetical protein